MTHVLIGVPARAEDKALWEAVPGCEFVYDEAFAAQNLAKNTPKDPATRGITRPAYVLIMPVPPAPNR